MTDTSDIIRIDKAGVLRVGRAGVPLDEIVSSHLAGHPAIAILGRFPSLTEPELRAALDYHLREDDGVPRGEHHRDSNWRRWDATLEEDLGTDTRPNEPIEKTD
jgi:uncharacterized protein (DUF433 family)